METFASGASDGRSLKRPRLRRSLQQIKSADGDLYLLDPGSERDLQIEQPDDSAKRLLVALDGSRTRDELEDEFGVAEVEEAITSLCRWGALEDAADEDLIHPQVSARFDRQLRYFSDVSRGPSPSECQNRLEAAAVAVLGVGGLGGWSALALASCGVGKMLLLDCDTVELTNLNRQVLYGESDIGRSKVEAAAERLSSLNSRMQVELRPTRIESVEDVRSAISGCDVVVDAVDWPAHDIEHWVNQACFEAGVPFMAMSHSPPMARVGPLYVPGTTGCYACQEIAYRREYELFEAMVDQLRAQPSPAPVVGPMCAQIGGHVALDLLHYLTGIVEPSTLGTAFFYDVRTMEQRRERVTREPDCQICR